MNGGIRVPMVVHWPAGIAGARTRSAHAVDARHRRAADDARRRRRRVAGASSTDGRTRALDGVELRAGAARSRRRLSRATAQHYELAGNRGYIDGGWKIVSLQPPGRADRPRQLDAVRSRRRSDRDDTTLRAQHPDGSPTLVAAFDDDALANHVYPLDNRGVRRSLTVPPYPAKRRSTRRARFARRAARRRWRSSRRWSPTATSASRARFDHAPPATRACSSRSAIRSRASRCYARDGRAARSSITVAQGDAWRRATLPRARAQRVRARLRGAGARRGAATLSLNGAKVAALDLSPTIILGLGVGEGLDVGCDRRLHVTPHYGGDGACAYTGRVDFVRIEPGAAGARQLRESARAARAARLTRPVDVRVVAMQRAA